MKWFYGPTANDPNPGSMWHEDCGGEVWMIDGAYICSKCSEIEPYEEEESDDK